jgi:hypothetical protein
MSCIRIALVFVSVIAWISDVQARPLDPALAPGQNFDLSSYRLQTLDTRLQFKEVNPVGTYQDRFFFTDLTTGAMTFRVPSGAGHTKDSKFPRVELRENSSWTMDSRDGRQHSESIVLQVLAEPKTGELIFAQIHGEKTGGSEALKMRWSHGEILMGVKKHYGDDEEKISLLRGLSLGNTIECHLEFIAADPFTDIAQSLSDMTQCTGIGMTGEQRHNFICGIAQIKRMNLTVRLFNRGILGRIRSDHQLRPGGDRLRRVAQGHANAESNCASRGG